MRLAIAAAALGLASAQNTYTWNGASFSMGSPGAWQGANPFNPNNLPTYTIFGTDNSRLASSVPTGMSIDVGSRIELHGTSTIFLGNGQGSGNTMITFGGSTGTRNNVATFAAPGAGQSTVTPVYDYTCNLNWLVSGQTPGWAPCTTDIVQIPTNNPYFISNFGRRGAANFIENQGSISISDRISQCNSADSMYGYTSFLGSNTVQLTNCASTFYFGTAGSSMYTCPSTASVAASCAGGNPNAIVTGTPAGSNEALTVVTMGPFAGQVFATSGGAVANRTGSVNIVTVTPPSGSTPGAYRIRNVVFNGQTGAVVADTTTVATTVAAAASGSSSGGGSMLLIIIVVIAVVVIIAVVIIVMKKKNASESSAAAHSAVSFENPMYDGAGPGAQGVAQTSGGLYQEPEMGTGGYMDVPAGEHDYDEAGTSGYMDVPAQGESETGGYMDVNEDDEDNDDV